MAQVVSHYPLTVEVQAQSLATPSGIYGGQCGNGKGFLSVVSFSRVSIILLLLYIP